MDSLIQVFLLLCLALEIQGTGHEDRNPILATDYGQLRGKTVRVKGTDQAVHAYFGIPFAKAPLGQLRFSPPQPAEPWGSIRDATQHPPMCLQNLAATEKLKDFFRSNAKLPGISEDCLFLNVFTPANRDKNSNLPVMVFIHGGGLVEEGASLYDGSALSAYENVVIVSIQYRLGILGFFSTGDEQAPGNFGFLDQVFALQWVQENIEDFGGDPRSVTIFGESAGGLSVAAHVLSPLSKGLFHRAISESGVALMPGLVISKAEEITFFRNLIANISVCDSRDSTVLLDCLKKKTEEEFTEMAAAVGVTLIPACVDGDFFPKSAEDILIMKESNRVPFMIGVNNHEFGWLIPKALNISGFTGEMDKDTVLSILHELPIFTIYSELLTLIMDEYFGDVDDPNEIRNRFIDFCGDFVFVLPAIRTAKYHRDSGLPVYFYEFQHRPSIFSDSKPDFVKSDHGDEVFSVLGGPFLGEDVIINCAATEEEKALSKAVMKYWANFARNGDPNGPGLAEWPEYSKEEFYLEINSVKQKPAKKLRGNREEFWTITLPEKIQNLQDMKKEHTEL